MKLCLAGRAVTTFSLLFAFVLAFAGMVQSAIAGDVTYTNPPGMFKHPAFTRVITVETPKKLLFVAGQTSSDEKYQCVGANDYRAQYIQVMENLRKILAAAGASFDDVVYRRTFVLDIDAYLKVITAPDAPRYFKAEKMPGATLVQVGRLSNPCFLVEIDMMAVLN